MPRRRSSRTNSVMEYITTPKIENVRLRDRFNARKPAVGTLYLTATHLIFVDPAGKKETWILHMHIASVEKLPLTTGGAPIQIRCKTFQAATFVIPREKDCQELYKSLQKLSNPAELEDLYAFHYKSATVVPTMMTGWDQFDLQAEYARMGIPNAEWCSTTINKNYEICDTYPKTVYVPTFVSTPVLVGSARFRSRGRLPVLSYLHQENKAAMCRCSQPLAGFSARCVEDEEMLQAILKTNPKSDVMYIVDTRPKINAMVNKASGKGYESTDVYTNIKFKFLGIENIHVMRSSLQKLIEVCELKNPSMDAFLSGLESSCWLKHIKAILDTSHFIAKAIGEEGLSVLVHCSDGWDRTAQTCSLASIILDPYYRTIQGFQVLIEKEWLAFGHKFLHRCGLLACDPREVSPVFTQFVDAAWQLCSQFPCAFQFNERFLLELHDHVFSSQFGNFLGNCEKERLGKRLSQKTFSLWQYMQARMSDYINPLYQPNLPTCRGMLKPDFSPQMLKFWRGMYNRYENGVHPRESVTDVLSAMKDHSTSLADHVQFLENQLAALKKLLVSESGNQEEKPDRPHIMENGGTESPLSLDKDSTITPKDDLSNEKQDSIAVNGGHPNNDMAPPLKTSPSLKREDSNEVLSASLMNNAVDSVATEWQSFRNIRQCSCSSPFDHFSMKYHCWKCGDVFCIRCIDKQTQLPGHESQRPVPVCRPCYKELKAGCSEPSTPSRSPSVGLSPTHMVPGSLPMPTSALANSLSAIHIPE
ncbi:phosphatidylinositol-3,5-bisphosphate 3-phosphatase MTMR8-like [Diadema setosum]|uniref:phosphatidylinositol-3,5-bisphosphate 3-phosphatase MTMR8-like n=1 Tax=Diadema setosum TaxID=31175 RepID=UPI003B3A5146